MPQLIEELQSKPKTRSKRITVTVDESDYDYIVATARMNTSAPATAAAAILRVGLAELRDADEEQARELRKAEARHRGWNFEIEDNGEDGEAPEVTRARVEDAVNRLDHVAELMDEYDSRCGWNGPNTAEIPDVPSMALGE